MKNFIEKSKKSINRLLVLATTLMLTTAPAFAARANVNFVKTSANDFQYYAIRIALFLFVAVVVLNGYTLISDREHGSEKVKKMLPAQIIGLGLVAFAPKVIDILADIFNVSLT